MSQKPSRRPPSAPDPEGVDGALPRDDEPEAAAADPAGGAPEEDRDPYEDLWDPDMDTRPVRIRRTRARPNRGKRRQGA